MVERDTKAGEKSVGGDKNQLTYGWLALALNLRSYSTENLCLYFLLAMKDLLHL
jgi:hypothetical protein